MMEEIEEVDIVNTPLALCQMQSKDSFDAFDEGPPDPRIQVELEKLNASTDLINKLEVELDEARMMFRQTLAESTQRIDNLTKRLGKCIDQARPYYEARISAKQALSEAQKSAVRYERAVSQHAAAREMVQLAEEGLLTRGCIFDSTWQEMLNHATTKVNDAEIEKVESASEHKEKSLKFHGSETRVKVLQKELKRSIAKSSLNARRSLLQLSNIVRMQELQLLPYFELKAAVNQRLEEQKKHVRGIEDSVTSAKQNYSQALTNLEMISNQIHQTRQNKLDLGVRGSGVGAESPSTPVSERKGASKIDLIGSSSARMNTQDNSNKASPKPSQTLSNLPLKSAITLESAAAGFSVEFIKNLNSRTRVDPNLILSAKELGSSEAGAMLGEKDVIISQMKHSGSLTPHWQFAPPLSSPRMQDHLGVDDADSLLSDSESLASIEMLSEDAIASLMLEDEINEAKTALCSSTLIPPSLPSGRGAASLTFVPGLIKSDDTTDRGDVLPCIENKSNLLSTEMKEKIKESNDYSSSLDDRWEIVREPLGGAVCVSTSFREVGHSLDEFPKEKVVFQIGENEENSLNEITDSVNTKVCHSVDNTSSVLDYIQLDNMVANKSSHLLTTQTGSSVITKTSHLEGIKTSNNSGKETQVHEENTSVTDNKIAIGPDSHSGFSVAIKTIPKNHSTANSQVDMEIKPKPFTISSHDIFCSKTHSSSSSSTSSADEKSPLYSPLSESVEVDERVSEGT